MNPLVLGWGLIREPAAESLVIVTRIPASQLIQLAKNHVLHKNDRQKWGNSVVFSSSQLSLSKVAALLKERARFNHGSYILPSMGAHGKHLRSLAVGVASWSWIEESFRLGGFIGSKWIPT